MSPRTCRAVGQAKVRGGVGREAEEDTACAAIVNRFSIPPMMEGLRASRRSPAIWRALARHLKKIPATTVATAFERFAKFVQTLALSFAALFALVYLASPQTARWIVNYLNPDQAWFFVALCDDDKILSNQRFHSGRAASTLSQDSTTGLIKINQILFPRSEYLAENIKETILNKTIVGRSKSTARLEENSEVWKVPTKGQCIYVHRARFGYDYTENGKTFHTIWALANVLECDRGY